ncbi:putative uncharacterized protein [Ruminococcus sp. CAG:563]|mgnify:FL=1|nr:putative uncharacterized protein [Ruminococcus sp. CAG:563]HJI45870.1 hypothetical protein [Oscillospiraceae bacterium]
MAKNKSKKSILMAVFAVIAFVLCVVALTGSAPRIRLSLAGGGKVSNGILAGVEADAHITSVPEGEIRYLINKRIMFENSYSLGNVMLENPESCQYDIKFVIYKDDGEMIYTSPMIKPGQCLEKDKLSTVVKAGEYNCSYSAQAYQNGDLKGEVTGVVTVTVG